MAKPKSRRANRQDENPMPMTEEREILSDELLFIESPDQPFWTAKCLSPRRAVRLHAWLARVLGSASQSLIGANVEDIPALLSQIVDILDETEFVEILSIASGHTREEIEAGFIYGEAMECLVDFVELNEIGNTLSRFFQRIGIAKFSQPPDDKPVET